MTEPVWPSERVTAGDAFTPHYEGFPDGSGGMGKLIRSAVEGVVELKMATRERPVYLRKSRVMWRNRW